MLRVRLAVEVADCIPVTGLVTPKLLARATISKPHERSQFHQRRSLRGEDQPPRNGAGQQDSRGLLPFGLTSCCYDTLQRGGNDSVLHGSRRRAIASAPGKSLASKTFGL